jgi:hypothetical protein
MRAGGAKGFVDENQTLTIDAGLPGLPPHSLARDVRTRLLG